MEPKSTQPKTSPQETPIWIKERVIELRKETGLRAKKLHWRLAKQGLAVPVSTIGKNDFRTVTFIASMTLLSAAIGQNLVIIFFVQKIIGRFDRSDGSIALMVLCLVFGFVELLGFIRSFYVHFVW